MLPRLGLAALVGLQFVWGLDVPFIGTHAMAHTSPIRLAAELAWSGYRKDYTARLHPFGDYLSAGQTLPKGAKVLVHEMHVHAGLMSMSVSDWGGWQGGLSYGRFASPAELLRTLRSWGVTHVLWEKANNRDFDSIGGDLAFSELVTKHVGRVDTFGGLGLAPLSTTPVAERPYDPVLFWGCPGGYQPGLYPFAAMSVPLQGGPPRSAFPAPLRADAPSANEDPNDAVDRAGFIAFDPGCHGPLPPSATRDFTRVVSRKNLQLWVRVRGEANPL